MKHLKKNIVSNISSDNNIVSKNSKNYADFGQKNKPTGLTGKKNRLFKSLGIGAMAVFMGILTVLGTACTSTQTNTNLENGSLASGNSMEAVKPAPSPLGLDPQNDPIIYTTESGLEIKYGGIDIEQSLASGALTGYPYFTMGTYDNKPVNWVIIGRNSNVTVFNNPLSPKLFSSWISNTNYIFSKYFFDNIYETSTPAGSAINNTTAFMSYIQDSGSVSLSSIKTGDSEIPSGCVFVISETCLGNSVYGSNGTYGTSTLNTYITNLLETGLGLSTTEQNLFQTVTVKTTGAAADTTQCQLFQIDDETGGTFAMISYIEYSQSITNSNFWLRGSTGAIKGSAHYMTTGGNRDGYMSTTNSCGVRPSGCVKII